MNKEDKLILGTLAGVDLVLSPGHYEEYKGTLNEQLEQKDKEIDRLNNIINELEEFLNKVIETGAPIEQITCKNILNYLQALKEDNKE